MVSEQVNLPVIGTVKRQYLYIGGAGVAGVVGYAWWNYSRTRNQDTVPGPTAGNDMFDSSATGLTDQPSGNVQYAGTVVDNSTLPSTNAEWTQRAIENLAGTEGWSPAAILTALGRYLARMSLNAEQRQIVLNAIAVTGPPPVGSFQLVYDTGENTHTPPPTPKPQPKPPARVVPVYKHGYKGDTVDAFLNYWRSHPDWLKTNPHATWDELVRLNPNVRKTFDQNTKKFKHTVLLRIR